MMLTNKEALTFKRSFEKLLEDLRKARDAERHLNENGHGRVLSVTITLLEQAYAYFLVFCYKEK